jgi:hypothetical protein
LKKLSETLAARVVVVVVVGGGGGGGGAPPCLCWGSQFVDSSYICVVATYCRSSVAQPKSLKKLDKSASPGERRGFCLEYLRCLAAVSIKKLWSSKSPQDADRPG